MEAVRIEIPKGIVRSLKMSLEDVSRKLTVELAVQLNGEKLLSFGKARELAGLSRWDFGTLLAEREIPRHYDEAELAEDLEFAAGE